MMKLRNRLKYSRLFEGGIPNWRLYSVSLQTRRMRKKSVQFLRSDREAYEQSMVIRFAPASPGFATVPSGILIAAAEVVSVSKLEL